MNVENSGFLEMPHTALSSQCEPPTHPLSSLLEVCTGSLANQPFLASRHQVRWHCRASALCRAGVQWAAWCHKVVPASAPILTFATRIVLDAATSLRPKLLLTSSSLQAAHRKAASGKSSETINKHGWELEGGRRERAICVVDKRRLPPSNYRPHSSTLLHIAVDLCLHTSTLW